MIRDRRTASVLYVKTLGRKLQSSNKSVRPSYDSRVPCDDLHIASSLAAGNTMNSFAVEASTHFDTRSPFL